MGARWYDPYINRFLSPDTVIPDPANPQSLNRFSYALGNPLRYRDPSGHWTEQELIDALGGDWREKYFGAGAVFEDREALLAFLLSENTTSALVLDIVADMFGAAGLAHGAGLDFADVDALGYRIAVGAGAVPFGSVSVDALLNLTAGEFSFFGSPEAGLLLGESATIMGGLVLMKNLPSNQAYRGTMTNVGVVGGEIAGLNAEFLWTSPMSDQFQPCDKACSGFLGVAGTPITSLGAYWSTSYSYEAYHLSKEGADWFSQPFNVLTVAQEVVWALGHDLLLHPVWAWSPYR